MKGNTGSLRPAPAASVTGGAGRYGSRPAPGWSPAGPLEPAAHTYYLLSQHRMWRLEACRPAYQHHVITNSRRALFGILRQQICACSLAEPAPHAIPRSRSAQLATDCNSHPPTAIRVGKCKCNQRATGEDTTTAHHAIKVVSSLEAEALLHVRCQRARLSVRCGPRSVPAGHRYFDRVSGRSTYRGVS